MNIENEICSSVISVVKELYGQDVHENMVQLQKTRSNFEGNLTLVVFPFLKISKKKPEDTAKEIGEALVKNCSAIAGYNVVKGFLNLVIAKEAWIGLLNDINANYLAYSLVTLLPILYIFFNNKYYKFYYLSR